MTLTGWLGGAKKRAALVTGSVKVGQGGQELRGRDMTEGYQRCARGHDVMKLCCCVHRRLACLVMKLAAVAAPLSRAQQRYGTCKLMNFGNIQTDSAPTEDCPCPQPERYAHRKNARSSPHLQPQDGLYVQVVGGLVQQQ